MILIIYAHPYPRHSHANKRLLQEIKDLPDVKIRSLYDLYPDFTIDIKAEQKAVEEADLIIFQHPMQWYGLPPLVKLWIDKVLEHGWAYGHGGDALNGKGCMWAVTTGGNEQHFQLGHHPDFSALAQPLEATALYCGMKWQPYFALHNTFTCDEVAISAAALAYRQRLIDWQTAHPAAVAVQPQAMEGETNG
ncbi:glutathione-regulated potassium-efflux system oxidoreductase KefF [Rouxiella sp. WC2420]|uniref:Glutathione-regulated potassium-efflux system oxidoreductase KefF n=1 Tax=Rouxiella sp. WC2420 TaxID=3234145 RepID=A0AB39VQL2_9GAMM